MKKHFILLSTLCVLLTGCDNYTSSHQGQPGSGSGTGSSSGAAGQQRGSTTDASGRQGGAQGPAGQQPGGPAGYGPDANRNNPRDQGR